MNVKELKKILANCPDDCEVWLEMTHSHIDNMVEVQDVEVTYASTLLDGDDPSYLSRIILSDRLSAYHKNSWAWSRMKRLMDRVWEQ